MKKCVRVLCLTIICGGLVSGFESGDVRLRGGRNSHEGRVEIFMNGQWGTVDDDPWDNDDAAVVCRQLGYLFGGVGYRSAHFGEGSGPIWLDDIGCTGSETNLLSCPHQTDTSEDSHSEDVGVSCNGQVRLRGGSGSHEGRVEIFMNGQWGTVDEDPWDDDDAAVVCRQLGYFFGGVGYKSAHFGEGSGPIWLDDIGCTGSETHLLNCPHQTDTSEDSHSEDVGVSCNGQVRLVDGNCGNEGRVEISLGGQWGTIDDDMWDSNDAYVVCRQLGYLKGGVAYRIANFGERSSPVLLDGINCTGKEAHLLNCSYDFATSEDSYSEDVAVSCVWPDADVCSSQPCVNNGRCINQGASYVCVCPFGYSGSRCENDTDVCSSQPCSNNGKCINRGTSYVCVCSIGYSGLQCENDADVCSSQPCSSNGQCVSEGNSFLCVCPVGYSGSGCEKERIKSYIPLILAAIALLAALVSLIKISITKRTMEQQKLPSGPFVDVDHVGMHIQPNQYSQGQDQKISNDVQQGGATCQSDDYNDIYENV